MVLPSSKKGEVILIKGPSSSGKTTLMKLLLGLYKPRKGQIYFRFDNKEVSIGIGAISYVPQNNFIIDRLSLSENVIIQNETVEKKSFENAIQLSGISDFSNELKNGFFTIINAR